ncbi:hypothetical protein CR513_16359, partial [Mucuna pruriens]
MELSQLRPDASRLDEANSKSAQIKTGHPGQTKLILHTDSCRVDSTGPTSCLGPIRMLTSYRMLILVEMLTQDPHANSRTECQPQSRCRLPSVWIHLGIRRPIPLRQIHALPGHLRWNTTATTGSRLGKLRPSFPPESTAWAGWNLPKQLYRTDDSRTFIPPPTYDAPNHPLINPTPIVILHPHKSEDPHSIKMLQLFEERLKDIEGVDYFDFNVTNLCLIPNVVIHPNFKLPEFDKYKENTCPKNHLTVYCRKMASQVHDDRLLIHFFKRTLWGPLSGGT